MSSSSLSPRHRGSRGGRLGRTPPTPTAEENKEEEGETRVWAELPLDAISSILHKLDRVNILMGAGQVCHFWRSTARDEPELWRRIDMLGHAELVNKLNLHGMAQEAVRRSGGRCEAFRGKYVGDDDFLLYLSDQAPSLKSLRLISCHDVSDQGFTEAIQKFPLLKERELSLCSNVIGSGVFEVVGKACPQLQRLRIVQNIHYRYGYGTSDYQRDEEARGIATMHKLRSLYLHENVFTNKGLEAILDNCRHLESLEIRCPCFNVKMDDTLHAKCARISSLRLTDEHK